MKDQTDLMIQEVTPSLKNLFEKYRHEGMLSIYLWGSVTTNDFNPATSDVDSIAIVDDDFREKLERIIQAELQNTHPAIKKFGFRVLYKKELELGKQQKSVLASYISPRFFIFDIPNWVHIVGKKYVTADFTDNPPTIDEMLKLRVDEIKNRNWEDASKIEDQKEEFYIKCLWRIVHLQQLQRGVSGPFAYSGVVINANNSEKHIVDVLGKIKASHYNREIYTQNIKILNSFVEEIKSR